MHRLTKILVHLSGLELKLWELVPWRYVYLTENAAILTQS